MDFKKKIRSFWNNWLFKRMRKSILKMPGALNSPQSMVKDKNLFKTIFWRKVALWIEALDVERVGGGIWGGCAPRTYQLFAGVKAVKFIIQDPIISYIVGIFKKKIREKPREQSKRNVWLTLQFTSVADPDPPDPRVFGPSGSGSISPMYGSGSGSGSFYH